jgi:hypothetical protein
MKEMFARVETACFAVVLSLQKGKVESKLMFSMVMFARLLLK